MGYRIRETGEYLATDSALRTHFKNVIRPRNTLTKELLESLGVDVVFEGPQATGGTVYQYSQFAGLELVGSVWFTKYILGPVFVDNKEKTAAQQEAEYKAIKDSEKAEIIREERNRLLLACDWTQLMDSPLAQDKRLAWESYRTALRNVPAQTGFPWNVTWPTKP